jgi:hypothetical protein
LFGLDICLSPDNSLEVTSIKGFLVCCLGSFIDFVGCLLGASEVDLVVFVCCFLVALICLGACVIKTSLIIPCVELCCLSLANGKAKVVLDLLSGNRVFGFDISKKVSTIAMQANRKIIMAKAISLRANKAPLRIAEIIKFS